MTNEVIHLAQQVGMIAATQERILEQLMRADERQTDEDAAHHAIAEEVRRVVASIQSMPNDHTRQHEFLVTLIEEQGERRRLLHDVRYRLMRGGIMVVLGGALILMLLGLGATELAAKLAAKLL